MRFLAALSCCIALSAQADTFTARVIAVMDGDTVMVLRNGQKLKVRLANIDAPEKDQAYGNQARASLLELVGRKQVQVDSQAVDQYGRIVGLISADGRNVNQEQLKRGMAWEYSHFHSDKTCLALQSAAQRAHRGLWSQANPQAPWQWRKLHPSTQAALHAQPHVTAHPKTAPVMLYDMACGRKHLCSQMASCDEARFYFNDCGVRTLDGNRDGIPCESLCDNAR